MKKLLLPFLALGLALSAYAGNCGSCTSATATGDKPAEKKCCCKSAEECKKTCGDKCDKSCADKPAEKPADKK